MQRQRLTSKIAAAEGASERRRDKGEMVRDISGFEYDKSKALLLKKALHNINVSLGTLISAMKELSILRGSEVTPDGKLGGRGFVMPFKELKAKLGTAITDLSDITDTLADELTNPNWDLSDSEKKKVKKENEIIDEKVEEVEEVVPGDTPTENEDLPPEVDRPDLDEVNPKDVVDSFEVEALRRYGDLIEGNSKDKVASVLSKHIMANLLKGDK